MLGGIVWSSVFTLLGYFFGGIPVVQEHFELVIVAIVLISLIPAVGGVLKAKFGKKKPVAATEGAEANVPAAVAATDGDAEADA